MKKATFIAVSIMGVLLLGNWAQAGVSVVVNGSFEDDGYIYDITTEEPNGWDVNVPADEFGDPKFGGWVWDDWRTDGDYSLTLYSYPTIFEANDMATVSQQVYLRDVNEVIFDIKLDTESDELWDPNECTAVLIIDNGEEFIWESNSIGPDVRGEYRDRVANIDIDDRALHTLSLGIRINVGGTSGTVFYTLWDSVGFELHCGDSGFLAGDFSRDCYVDANGLEMLTEVWLSEVDPNEKRNLCRDDDVGPFGIINFRDFAFFAEVWDGNMPDLEMFIDQWLYEVDSNDEYNLFRGDDIGPMGIINFLDFTIFADDWLKNSYE